MERTILKFQVTEGPCYNEGIIEVNHNFDNVKQLIQYLRENWHNLENADLIEEIEITYDTDGEFKLIIEEYEE